MFNFLLRKNKISLKLYCHQKKFSAQGIQYDNVGISDSLAQNNSICNKSGLLNQHRNFLHRKVPYKEPHSWIHSTEKFQRKIFARYGSESGVMPRICFTANSDSSKIFYEDFVDNDTCQSMISKYKFKKSTENEKILKREEEIAKKIEKLNQWQEELNWRINKKEAVALAAKEKKDRLVEEVRRHFGYKIDPKDERFKEVLDQKEKEDRRKQKEAKRKAKEQKLMTKLVENSDITSKSL